MGGRQSFRLAIHGRRGAPVVFRPVHGEHVTINGSMNVAANWVVIRDFEVTNTHPQRRSDASAVHPPDDIERLEGIIMDGSGIQVINNVVHDTGTFGIDLANDRASDNVVYGNVVYNNGWDAPDHGQGRGIHGSGLGAVVQDNVAWNNFAFSVDLGTLGGETAFEGNVAIHQSLRIRGPAEHLMFRENAVYGRLQLGYPRRVNKTLTASRNVIVGRRGNFMGLWNWGEAQVFRFNRVYTEPATSATPGVPSRSTTFLEYSEKDLSKPAVRSEWEANTYVWGGADAMPFRVLDASGHVRRFSFSGNPGWREFKADGFPGNETQGGNRETVFFGGGARPTENTVLIRENREETRRGLITVFNWEGRDRIEVDLARLGFSQDGEQYEIWNVQNLCGDDPIVGTYRRGAKASVPMHGWSQAEPIGYDDASTHHPGIIKPLTLPRFGVFLVTSRKLGTLCGACDHYVAADAPGGGTGSSAEPWTAEEAFRATSVAPGAQICFVEGRYGDGGGFRSADVTLRGAPPLNGIDRSITLKPYPGDHVVLDDGLNLKGSWLRLVGFTITNSAGTRISRDPRGRDTQLRNGIAIVGQPKTDSAETAGDGIQVIHNVVRDTVCGLLTNGHGDRETIRGNIIYNNGFDTPGDRGHGCGMRVPNVVREFPAFESEQTVVYGNLLFNNFANEVLIGQECGTLPDGSLPKNGKIRFEKNGLLDSPSAGDFAFSLKLRPTSRCELGAYELRRNYGLGRVAVGQGAVPYQDLVMHDNRFISDEGGGYLSFAQWRTPDIKRNFFQASSDDRWPAFLKWTPPQGFSGAEHWNHNHYFYTGSFLGKLFNIFSPAGMSGNRPFSFWQSQGFDRESTMTFGEMDASADIVEYVPSVDAPRRGHVLVWNPSRSPTASIDLAELGFERGRRYQIRNALDLCSETFPNLIEGYYQGSALELSMRAEDYSVANPQGYRPESYVSEDGTVGCDECHPDWVNQSSFPRFGMFVVTDGTPGLCPNRHH